MPFEGQENFFREKGGPASIPNGAIVQYIREFCEDSRQGIEIIRKGAETLFEERFGASSGTPDQIYLSVDHSDMYHSSTSIHPSIEDKQIFDYVIATCESFVGALDVYEAQVNLAVTHNGVPDPQTLPKISTSTIAVFSYR